MVDDKKEDELDNTVDNEIVLGDDLPLSVLKALLDDFGLILGDV